MSVSVIIASYNSSGTIRRCLDSLEAQIHPGVEVIVADSSSDDTPDILAMEYPWVRLIRSPLRRYPGAARNEAISEANGEILAFIDADCIADDDWIERCIAAQQEWGPVVGGSVKNANPADRNGWIYYFAEFARWMPSGDGGWMEEIPTCCLTVQRSVLERTGLFRTEGYCSDTAFHWRLAKAGISSRFEPAMSVSHINPTSVKGILTKMLMHGEHFARTRCEEKQISRPVAFALWLGAPLLPALLVGRRIRQIWRDESHRQRLVLTIPGLTAALTAWSVGEWRGYGRKVFRD